MSTTTEGKPFRFIPKTTVGKVLLILWLLAFVAVALSVTGFVFNSARLFLGLMPEAVFWAYLWFAVMNGVLIGTYIYLFKPWAEAATRYVDEEEASGQEISQEDQPPGDITLSGSES